MPEIERVAGAAAEVRRALEADRDVVAALPLDGTPGEWNELAALARERRRCATFEHRALSPPFAQARAAVDAGRLGLPWALQLHLVVAPPEEGNVDALLLQAVDLLRALTGLEPVSARGSTAGDLVTASLELDHGVLATLAVGPSPAAAGPAGGLRRLVLLGSQGMLAFEEDRPRLDVRSRRRSDASRAAEGGSRARSLEAIADDLRRARGSGGQPLRTLADAARALEVVDVIRTTALPHAFTRG